MSHIPVPSNCSQLESYSQVFQLTITLQPADFFPVVVFLSRMFLSLCERWRLSKALSAKTLSFSWRRALANIPNVEVPITAWFLSVSASASKIIQTSSSLCFYVPSLQISVMLRWYYHLFLAHFYNANLLSLFNPIFWTWVCRDLKLHCCSHPSHFFCNK